MKSFTPRDAPARGAAAVCSAEVFLLPFQKLGPHDFGFVTDRYSPKMLLKGKGKLCFWFWTGLASLDFLWLVGYVFRWTRVSSLSQMDLKSPGNPAFYHDVHGLDQLLLPIKLKCFSITQMLLIENVYFPFQSYANFSFRDIGKSQGRRKGALPSFPGICCGH